MSVPVFVCRSCASKALKRLRNVSARSPSQTWRSYSRPSNAPKPQLDLKHIRRHPGLYEQDCQARNYPALAQHSWRILELHQEWQQCQANARRLRERSNTLKQSLARQRDDAAGTKTEILTEARKIKAELSPYEEKESQLQSAMQSLALELPNLSSTDTPMGAEPEVLSYLNEHPDPSPSTSGRRWRSHTDIGASLNLLDFSSAATTSGWGWYYLLNSAALLEQALIQYAMHTCIERGWRLVSPPSMVYAHMAGACGFQPRDQHGETQIYGIESAEKEKDGSSKGEQGKPSHVLAGTAEIPLAGLKANTVFKQEELPLKVVGVSRCYRAEAGARGVDTKGLYRVHEFTKVEMFAWTLPDASTGSDKDGSFATAPQHSCSVELFDEMVELQRAILAPLGLHCRVLSMPSTDLGASAARKIDIEAFFPSRREKDEGWGEVTSASNCTDYQSRRLDTRVKYTAQDGGLEFAHTVNGTALAIPRVIAAILENGWDEEKQAVKVPEVLKKWMAGMEYLRRE